VKLSFTVIFILSIDIRIESWQSVVNHMALDKLADFHVSGQQFISVTVTVPIFFRWLYVQTKKWNVYVCSKIHGEGARFYEAEAMPKLKHSKPGLLSMVNCGNNM